MVSKLGAGGVTNEALGDIFNLFEVRKLAAKYGKKSTQTRQFIETLSPPMQNLASGVDRTAASLKRQVSAYFGIGQAEKNIVALGDAAAKSAKSQIAFNESMKQGQTAAGQIKSGADDAAGAMGSKTGSKMGSVLKSLAGVAGMALASYGVDLLIRGIDKLIVTTDEHREQLAGLKNDYSGVAAALDNVNAQAAQTESRLESIAEGGVTEQEQQEYDQLIEERAGQTEDKAFLSASERAKQEAVRAEFAATMKSAVGSTVTFTNPSGTVDTTNIAGESAWRAAGIDG